MRLIDADKLKIPSEELIAKMVISLAPTIELVRCKDCRHRYVDGENVRYNVCELNHNKVQNDDWYCADAERRDR